MDSKNAAGELTTQPQATVKQEKVEPVESTNETPELSSEAQSYILQQQQLQYQSDFPFKESQGSNADGTASNTSANSDEPIAKRPRRRRQATKPIPPEAIESSDDNDAGDSMMEMTVTKTEEESESDGDDNADDPEPDKYVAVGDDTDQPGPSGLGKGNTDTPLTFKNFGQLAVFVIEDDHEEDVNVNPFQSEDFDLLEREDVMIFQTDSFNDEGFTNSEEENRVEQPKSLKKNASREQSIVCSECGKLVRYKHYDKHTKSHTYKCQQCPETFGTQRAYEAHIKVHSNNSFTCSICNIDFGSAEAFSIHNQKHSGSFKCPLCPFETSTKTSMKPHIKLMHMKEYKRVCEICGKGFLNNATYSDHMTLHLGEKKYKCEYCDKKFVLNRYLDIHKKLNHKDIINGVEEYYSCQVCNRAFKFEKSLIRHLSCIHDIGVSKRVPCPICNKVLANNYGLKIHMRTHSGEKPYSCELCDAKFARTKYLQKHMAKHVNM